jgi:hypothetical protein
MDDDNLKYQLARSFDAALGQFLASEGSEADTAENRGRLAARLVVLSKLGETDEHQLASNAALYLRALQERCASLPALNVLKLRLI